MNYAYPYIAIAIAVAMVSTYLLVRREKKHGPVDVDDYMVLSGLGALIGIGWIATIPIALIALIVFLVLERK